MVALHYAVMNNDSDFVDLLLLNGADVNAATIKEDTALSVASNRGHRVAMLQLLCYGASIDEKALNEDPIDEDLITELLKPINDRLNLLRAGERIGTSLLSKEERHYMWKLAFFFTIKHRVAAFKAFYAIRSFITYHGIFMARGYSCGIKSVWNKRRRHYNYYSYANSR